MLYVIYSLFNDAISVTENSSFAWGDRTFPIHHSPLHSTLYCMRYQEHKVNELELGLYFDGVKIYADKFHVSTWSPDASRASLS
jgi:hypothetical protein